MALSVCQRGANLYLTASSKTANLSRGKSDIPETRIRCHIFLLVANNDSTNIYLSFSFVTITNIASNRNQKVLKLCIYTLYGEKYTILYVHAMLLHCQKQLSLNTNKVSILSKFISLCEHKWGMKFVCFENLNISGTG